MVALLPLRVWAARSTDRISSESGWPPRSRVSRACSIVARFSVDSTRNTSTRCCSSMSMAGLEGPDDEVARVRIKRHVPRLASAGFRHQHRELQLVERLERHRGVLVAQVCELVPEDVEHAGAADDLGDEVR